MSGVTVGARTGAVLALWNDIKPARIDEYERWHVLEHVPERVWVPGFIAGTRYVAEDADGTTQPRYFTLYELDSLEPLRSVTYRTLVEQPTPWSASMRPAFTSFQRVTGPLMVDTGAVIGAALLAVRAVWLGTKPPCSGVLQAIADALLATGEATRVQIGWAEPAGLQALPNSGPAVPPGQELLFLVQALRAGGLATLESYFDESAATLLQGCSWQQRSRFRFASRVLHADVAAPWRPAPRLHLMRQ